MQIKYEYDLNKNLQTPKTLKRHWYYFSEEHWETIIGGPFPLSPVWEHTFTLKSLFKDICSESSLEIIEKTFFFCWNKKYNCSES